MPEDGRLWELHRGDGVCIACNLRHRVTINFGTGTNAYPGVPTRSFRLCENCSRFISQQLGVFWGWPMEGKHDLLS